MRQVSFKLPTIKDVEFTIECMREDMPVKGNAISSGDDDFDKKTEDSIIDALNNGNEWAWCMVQVTAKYKGIYGYDNLGGCSYKSKEDFMKDGYFEDMKQVAFDNLIENLEGLND
jgi:hypothetical protein